MKSNMSFNGESNLASIIKLLNKGYRSIDFKCSNFAERWIKQEFFEHINFQLSYSNLNATNINESFSYERLIMQKLPYILFILLFKPNSTRHTQAAILITKSLYRLLCSLELKRQRRVEQSNSRTKILRVFLNWSAREEKKSGGIKI